MYFDVRFYNFQKHQFERINLPPMTLKAVKCIAETIIKEHRKMYLAAFYAGTNTFHWACQGSEVVWE